jgi:SsrA-binding protein
MKDYTVGKFIAGGYHTSMSTLIDHKKAHFNYEITDTFEAGIELFGFEVKAVRSKQGSLEGSHVTVRGGEAYLIGSTIPPYQAANTPESYDPLRNRRLLLTKKELGMLAGLERQKGLTVVPISMYTHKRKIKLRIGIARGKKKFDKRETIKERETKRTISREMKAER